MKEKLVQIDELKTELKMRHRVWRRVPGSSTQFMDLDHNRRFYTLMDTFKLLDEMTNKEFTAIVERIERRRIAEEVQLRLEL